MDAATPCIEYAANVEPVSGKFEAKMFLTQQHILLKVANEPVQSPAA
jgi:hypothetical protein